MGAITADGVYRVEHDLISKALMNSGTSNDDRLETFDYIFGVNDMAEQLLKELKVNGNTNN